jgi:hypothetical protein
MGIWEKLQNVDKRVFYVLLTLAIAVPIVVPLGLPIRITQMTKPAYDFINTLPEGSPVIIGFDYEPGNEIDLNPQAIGLFHQFAAKKLKVVALSSFPPTPLFAEQTLKVLEEQYGYKYGEDYVNLGYYAGAESTYAAFAEKPLSIFPKDYRGNSTATLPIMQNIKGLGDFKLAVTLNDGPADGITIEGMIRQANMAYKVPLLIGCTPVMSASNFQYVQSGQALGMLIGLSGAAEYEILTGHPGPGVKGMDSQSVAHMLIIAFVILGNTGYFITKSRKAKGGASN